MSIAGFAELVTDAYLSAVMHIIEKIVFITQTIFLAFHFRLHGSVDIEDDEQDDWGGDWGRSCSEALTKSPFCN